MDHYVLLNGTEITDYWGYLKSVSANYNLINAYGNGYSKAKLVKNRNCTYTHTHTFAEK